MSYLKKIVGSFAELKNIYSLAAIAMLLALRVVLGFFANGTLAFFGNNVKLSGFFLPIAVTGAMFGPIPAAITGALGDIVSFLINPVGMYFPGFTISGFVTGMIYGLVLYKGDITLIKVIIAWVVNMLAVETFLAAYWLYLLYGAGSGSSYSVYLYARLISEAIKCIPEILLIFAVGKLAVKIKIPHRINNRQ